MLLRIVTVALSCLPACSAPADFHYAETDPLPGVDLPTRLAHVSQLDLLADTTGDHERCSCADRVDKAFELLTDQDYFRLKGMAA